MRENNYEAKLKKLKNGKIQKLIK